MVVLKIFYYIRLFLVTLIFAVVSLLAFLSWKVG